MAGPTLLYRLLIFDFCKRDHHGNTTGATQFFGVNLTLILSDNTVASLFLEGYPVETHPHQQQKRLVVRFVLV